MKRLLTLLASTAMLLTAHAQKAGDYVYTDNGRFKITTGHNLLTNGDFDKGTADWTTDGGNTLSPDTFGIELENGNNYLTVYNKLNGPGTGSSLLRKVAVNPGECYVVTYQVRGDDESITTTVTSSDNAKNYQNIFFNYDGSLTPADYGNIATPQTYSWDWTTVNYAYKSVSPGYIVIHFYAPYINTNFDNFAVMSAVEVVDDRAAQKVIDKLQSYIDNPLFPNGNDMLREVINDIQGFVDNDDFVSYNDLVEYLDELVNEYLDMNSARLTGFMANGNFDDLTPTGANQRKAGAWTIDDITPATGKTRWAIKSVLDTNAPFDGIYLQDDVPGPYYLREATVHQTMNNMPAGQYMFTVKARAGYQNKNYVFQDFTTRGLKVFINNDSTECHPISYPTPDTYTVYSTLPEPGDLKLGFFVTDSCCNHIDFDVVDLRIIGWTAEMAEEHFLGKELAEARQNLKHSIDSARVHYNDALMYYGKVRLDSAITASQYYYDNISITDSLADSRTRLNKEISVYIGENGALTEFRAAIANATNILADNSYAEADKQALKAAIEAAKAYLASLNADNHEQEGFTNADIKEQTTLLNKAINVLLISKLEADEKYQFLIWAQQDGAEYISNLLTGEDNAITSSSGSTVYVEQAPFAGHSLNNRLGFIEGLQLTLNPSHGMEVNLPTKNKTTMHILNLKQGDRIVMDWTMGSASHNIMISSANAKVRLADGSWCEYTKQGKDNANVLPKDNADGLSGSVRSTIIMTADGTLDFYQYSSASTIRIKYLDITNAENVVDGISEVTGDTRDGATDAIYDLQGRKLNNIPAAGIYIRGGKKVMVK